MPRVNNLAAALGLALIAACRSAPEQASHVGRIVDVPPGSFLSAQPGAQPTLMTSGSPALVIDERPAGDLRIFAADGISGWIGKNAISGSGVAADVHQPVPAVDRSPDENAAASAVELAPPLRVVGASERSAVASVQQNMIPEWRNWLKAPWLKLAGSGGTGWAPPSDISLSWDDTIRAGGVVRVPFTTPLSPLVRASVKEGAPVFRVEDTNDRAAGGTVRGDELPSTVRTAVITAGNPDALLLSSPNARLVRMATGTLLFTGYPPELDRAACADVDGDAAPECFAAVTQLTGDGPFTTLWMVTPSAASAFPLQAASGEAADAAPQAEWGIDAALGGAWIVRSTPAATRVSLVAPKSGEHVVSAAAAVLPLVDTPEAAIAAKIRAARSELAILPIASDNRIRWTAGRLFRSTADAERWRASSTTQPPLTVIALPAQ